MGPGAGMSYLVKIEHPSWQPACLAKPVYPAPKRQVQIRLSFSYSWPKLTGIALLVSVAGAFYLSPVHYLEDSTYSLLMDEALIHDWTPNMIHYQVPRGHGGVCVNDG